MSDDPGRDVEIFTAALRIPVDERAAFLEQACAGDGELRREVEALLSAHERVGNFLEKPPLETGPEVRTEEGFNRGKEKRNNGGTNDK